MISSRRDTGPLSLLTAERNPEYAGGAVTVNTREPCLLSLLREVLGWLRLFFFRIGCRPWAALLNSSSPPSRYPQTPDAATRTVWGRWCRTSVPVLLWPMSPPNACEGSSSSAGATLRRRRGTTASPRWGHSAAWAQAQGWLRDDPLAGIERRPQVRDDTAPIRYEQLHALWTRAEVHRGKGLQLGGSGAATGHTPSDKART